MNIMTIVPGRAWRPGLAPLVMLAALGMAGCGSNARITGKVGRGGQPVSAAVGARLNVAFHPISDAPADPNPRKAPGPDSYTANVASDGTFDVPGLDGDGIPPGKYRVSVELRAGRDRSGSTKRRKVADIDKDLLGGAFAPDKSPIIREVKSSQILVIDLDKPEA